jgi:NADPH2:quinone reductase
MKSVIYSEPGHTSVLRVVERPVPEPGPGEVRVRVVVSGVNPTDWKSRSGNSRIGAPAAEELTPNQDGAGVIDAVGPGVDGHRAGDRVWIFLAADRRPTGTAQEFTVVPAGNVVRLPDDVGFEAGASLGVPAMTAHRALTVAEDGPRRLSPGALTGVTVLVAGGAGAVGHATIQLARWAGATVIATISGPAKAALATAAGAQHVVNYREGDPAAAIRAIAADGVDLVVEVAPAPNLALDLAVLKTRGTIAVYATDGGTSLTFEIGPNMVLNTRLQFLLLYTVGAEALRAAAEDITAALEAGALPVGEEHGLPLHRFPLDDTAGAHDAVEAGAIGKVLIDVGPVTRTS